jgi:cytochrome b561
LYDRTSVWLHWVIGVAILAQFALGWWMLDVPKEPPGLRAGWYNVHKSIGITLGAFVLLRLLWRLSHPAPQLPGTLPKLQRLAAIGTHWALYACMLVMPITGYLGSSFTKYPIKYFGHTLPHWGFDWPAGKALASNVHFASACLLGALIALHVAAALWHLARRDGLFARMLPRARHQGATAA